MLVYEVIVVLIPILKWIACCDASVIILCRCTISTFALVILTPLFCFVNACHEPTIFLIPSGKWIVCCIACAVAPCKCAITTFTSTAIFCFWPHWLVKIAWFYVFPLNWEGLWSFAFCPYMVGYQLKWLLVQSEGGSISNLLVNVSSFNFYLFCKVRFGWHPSRLAFSQFQCLCLPRNAVTEIERHTIADMISEWLSVFPFAFFMLGSYAANKTFN